jgi:hypothetical protein
MPELEQLAVAHLLQALAQFAGVELTTKPCHGRPVLEGMPSALSCTAMRSNPRPSFLSAWIRSRAAASPG